MLNFDSLKLSVEAASGGKQTVIFDDRGLPSIMYRIPKLKSSDLFVGGSPTTHPAFIVNGSEVDEILVSVYQNIVVDDRAYSLPYKDPRVYINFDQAKAACEAKGRGWHLMTNAEYAALALWCKKNGYFPTGNNSYGKDASHPYETGTVSYTYESDGKSYNGRVYTGSGPVAWRHDGTASGIDSLNGNVWEWSAGLRFVDGEIQVIPDNNAAAAIDQSLNSGLWKAFMPNGSLVTPGTNGTLKFDFVTTPAAGGKFQLATSLTNKQTTEDPYGYQTFESTAAKSGVSVPEILKALAIMPADSESHGADGYWMRNVGERLPLRGGDWGNGSRAGVFALNVNVPRAHSNHNVGFRSALSLIVRSAAPMGPAPVHREKGIYFRARRLGRKNKESGRW